MGNPNKVLEMIDTRVKNITSGIMTTLPGKIISYDGSLATVQPTVKFNIPDGRELDFPIIVGVPVIFLAGAGGTASVTIPIKQGDVLLLHFASQSIDGWISGRETEDPRKHDLTDCFATPGPYPQGVSGYKSHPDDVVLYNSGSLVRVTPGGPAYCNTDFIIEGNLTVQGSSKMEQAVQMNSTLNVTKGATLNGSLYDTHRHSDVESGPDDSGPPTDISR